MWIYILLSVLGFLILLCGIWLIILIKVTREHKREYADKMFRFEELKSEWIKVRNWTDKMYTDRIAEFDKSIDEKIKNIEELENTISERRESLNAVTEKLKESGDNYVGWQEKIQSITGELDELYKKKEELVKELEEMLANVKSSTSERNSLVMEVNDLKERKRLAILNLNEFDTDLWNLDISDRDLKLIGILKQIEIDYPEFAAELSTIEWRKIWLPQLQVLVGEKGLSGQKGIYRLVLKSDPDVCYVGQAVDIKARWYEHVKKMIGIDAKGNEKLYKYRPEDFYWTVIERDPKDLDEAERYWIEFFGCKEKGLNKK